MNDSAERTEPQRRQEFFFWFCAAVSLLSLLGSHSLFWLEPRVAEAAREVTVTGQWYPFTVNFEPCAGLPPLEVWSIALIFKLAQKLGISEFLARLPSALTAFALLIGVFRLAKRLFDRRTALLTAWLTLGSFGLLYMGHCCVPGVLPAAIVVWALVLFLSGAGRRSFWIALAVCLLLAAGVLNCGSRFFFLAIALLAPWMFADRSCFHLKAFAAVLLAALILGLAWVFLFGPPWGAIREWAEQVSSVEGARAMLKLWLVRWCRIFDNPAGGVYAVTLIILPWAPIMFAALGGALYKIRRMTDGDRCLLTGIVAGFLVLALPATAQRADFLPLVPFLMLETGVCVLRGDGGKLTRWAVVATRAVFMVLASFAVVSPVTIPLLRRAQYPVPSLFWAVLFGGAVLLIMMLDSYPTRPLPRLTGLPDPLGSTILGGTLLSICFLSFLMPSLRELRMENLVKVYKKTSDMNAGAIINIGDRESTVMQLFYTRSPGRIATIPDPAEKRSGEELVRELSRHPGKRVAVIARYRRRELELLQKCAAAANLDVKIKKPDCKEEIPDIYTQPPKELEDEPLDDRSPFIQHACWLVTVPGEGTAVKNDSSTNVRNKGM